MSRQRIEREILETEFAHFTPEVRKHISHLVSSKCCHDTSDVIIDGLWEACRDETMAILSQTDPKTQLAAQEVSEHLLQESRELMRSYIDKALTREADLGDLDADNFENAYKAVFAPLEQAKRERRALSARENDRWAFFNQLHADADFDRWRERLLSPAQVAALSFGKDPDVVTPESLKPYRGVVRSPFREAFNDRLDLIEAAVAMGSLSVPMSVRAFVQWATAQGLVPPPGLMGDTNEAIGNEAAFWKEKYEIAQSELENLRRGLEDLEPKSKTSIYMLLVGMAAARFGYRTDQRSEATSAIMSGLEDVNLSLKKDAIRSNLEEATQALDCKWTTPITWSGIKRSRT